MYWLVEENVLNRRLLNWDKIVWPVDLNEHGWVELIYLTSMCRDCTVKCGCLSSFSSFYAGLIQLCECVGWEWSGKGTLGRSCGHRGLVAGAISFSSEGKQKVGKPSSVGHRQGPWVHNSAAKGISFCGPEMLSGWVGTTWVGIQRHQWDSSLFLIKHTVLIRTSHLTKTH